MKFHLVAAVAVLALGWRLSVSALEGAVLALVVGFVIVAEIMNSAIERLLDRLAPQRNPLTGLIKDMMAGAVLVAALTALVVGWFILGKKVLG